MKQFEISKTIIVTMGSFVYLENKINTAKLFVLLLMVSLCLGEARQYGESTNDIFTRPEGRGNRRTGGRMKLLTPDESNADVLKELGVDLSKEGKSCKLEMLIDLPPRY